MATAASNKEGIKHTSMYTIAISNEKGGVAKTTTSVSLGACLAEIGCQVLLLDLDPQANMSLALGREVNKQTISIASAIFGGTSMDELIRPTGVPSLSIIPSNCELGLAERILPARQNQQHMLKNLISRVNQTFDFVLIDCPPMLGVLTQNAIVAADLLMIPTQAEYFSFYALRSLMSSIRQVRKHDNPNLTYRLLLTMFDRRNRTHRILSEQLSQSFKSGMLNTIIEIDTKLREAPIAGIPIIYHAPKCRAALQYRALAQEIFVYAQETAVQPA